MTDPIAPELDEQLKALARVPVLLVASDYDGTLAAIVDDPADAKPNRDSMVAIRGLQELPATQAAIISGRSLADLARLTGDPEGAHLVGSHGSEFDPDFASSLDPQARELRDRVHAAVDRVAASAPGFSVEVKPASIAFHYRNAEQDAARTAVAELMASIASLDGVHVKNGKMVLEFAVIPTSKGAALTTIRQRLGASAVLFVGDDVTDEDAFVTLAGPDVGLKVGPGATAARYRVGTTDDVARVLARLYELREQWASGAEAVPIESHAMLTDQRTVALVAPGARVVWMCAPRIDSSAIFAELLGGPAAGHFTITPVDTDATPDGAYLGDSFHLRTAWPTVSVTDFLDCSGGRVIQRAGRTDLVRVIEGSGPVRIEFAPRLDFGRVPTRFRVRDEGLEVEDTFDPIVLRSPGVAWTLRDEGQHQTAIAEIDLTGREPLVLELRYGTGAITPSIVGIDDRAEQTMRFWASWAEQLHLPALATDAVRRSALVLRGLHYAPTGAFAAAGTTSLPEWIGGVRNWDYRYCWPRDASMSASALVRLGSTAEAIRLLDWLLNIVDQLPSPDRLSPIYTVSGGHLGPEAEIAELSGYAGSRPVRIGNAASQQLQLDVFGPIVELVHLLLVSGAPLSGEHWRLVEAMCDAVIMRWQDPDHGIWEVRGPGRHYVHSKVMCWQTLHLGVEIAERFLGRMRPAWSSARDAIAADVVAKGFDADRNAFMMAYDSPDVDAAVLAIGLAGLLEPTDPRFVGTIESIERALVGGGSVYRYRCDDHLPGAEGGFHLCTTWLIRALAHAGRVDDARALFAQYLEAIGPTGLMPEEIDPRTGRGLGNHPQAYSHLGLIEAALLLDGMG